jgi:phage internal scaffolding protein
MEFRSAYGEKIKVQIECEYPGKTIQSMKDSTDVNRIVDRFTKTGVLQHVNKIQGIFGDVSEIGAMQDVIKRQMEAEAAFLQLPAKVRAKFENEPENLLLWISDEDNYKEAVSLGLMSSEAVKAKQEAENASQAAEKAARIKKLRQDLKEAQAQDEKVSV